MTHEHGSSSSSCSQNAFDVSHRLACEQLANIIDLRQQCLRSSAQYIEPNEIGIDYLNQSYHITIRDCRIQLEEELWRQSGAVDKCGRKVGRP
jgi:hypothetical protein